MNIWVVERQHRDGTVWRPDEIWATAQAAHRYANEEEQRSPEYVYRVTEYQPVQEEEA